MHRNESCRTRWSAPKYLRGIAPKSLVHSRHRAVFSSSDFCSANGRAGDDDGDEPGRRGQDPDVRHEQRRVDWARAPFLFPLNPLLPYPPRHTTQPPRSRRCPLTHTSYFSLLLQRCPRLRRGHPREGGVFRVPPRVERELPPPRPTDVHYVRGCRCVVKSPGTPEIRRTRNSEPGNLESTRGGLCTECLLSSWPSAVVALQSDCGCGRGSATSEGRSAARRGGSSAPVHNAGRRCGPSFRPRLRAPVPLCAAGVF